MTDTIETLADEFWSGHLAAEPTEAHLLGYYPTTGRFEDASRAAEDAEIARLRDVAARAERIDAADLDEQERTTRAVLVSQATTTADLLEARLAEVSADPIFGLQDALPLILGMLTLPDAEVADAMPDMLAGAGRWFADVGAAAPRGRRPRLGPAAFAVTGTSRRSSARWPGRSTRTRSSPRCARRKGSTSTPGAPGWRPRWRPGCVRDWRRTATCCATRSCPRRGPTTAPGSRSSTAATTPTPDPALLHDHRPQRPGDPRHRPGPDRALAAEYRTLGAEASAPPTSRRSSTRCATTPRCTSPAATSWSARPRRRWPGPGRDGRLVRGAAAGAVRRRGHDDRREGVLLPAGHRRQPRRHVLHQRRRPDGVGHASSSRRWRSTRASPATTSSSPSPRELPAGPRVPQAHAQLGLRRGLGPLHRAALRRDGPLHRPGRAARDAVRGLDAGQPARRRHRPARPRLEPGAGGPVHARQLAAVRRRRAARRSTATSCRRARRRPT